MNLVKTSYGNIHVETHGSKDNPKLLLLNGIMMSTQSWAMFLPSITTHAYVILLDFMDQGQSDKASKPYTVHDQTHILYEVLQALNIEKLNVCGISYGGEVALDFSVQYPQMVEKLMVFNTTAKTSVWLKDIGDSWIKATHDPLAFYLTTLPTIYSHQFYETHQTWMTQRKEILLGVFSNPEFMQSMIRLTQSSESFDVLPKLSSIKVPTLVVSSDLDTITPSYEQEKIAKAITSSTHIILKGCGHASMYEQPNTFISLVLGHISHQHSIEL
jgi:3-oxoadipate enol-lactonase